MDQIHKNTPTDPTELFCKNIEKVKRRIQIHTKLHNFHRFYTKMTLNQIFFRHDSKHSIIISFFWLFLKIIIMCSVLCRFPQILTKLCIFWTYLISCLYTSHQIWCFLWRVWLLAFTWAIKHVSFSELFIILLVYKPLGHQHKKRQFFVQNIKFEINHLQIEQSSHFLDRFWTQNMFRKYF